MTNTENFGPVQQRLCVVEEQLNSLDIDRFLHYVSLAELEVHSYPHRHKEAAIERAIEKFKMDNHTTAASTAGKLVYRFMGWAFVFHEKLLEDAFNLHFGHGGHPVPAIG